MRSDQEHLDLFRMYVDQIGQHPLLTKQDEIEPSQAYQAGLDALRKLADCAADDLAQAVTSLETPVGEDGAVLGDFLEDDSAVGPDELVVRAAASRRLQRARRPSSREAAAIPAAVAPSRAAKSTARLPGRPSSSWRRALTS
jgi:Sigma-70 factor, region 1.2